VSDLGGVLELWRYPVKSMRGETCSRLEFFERGVVGDRSYALVDAATGRVASAKNPRLWPNLLSFGARYLDEPASGNGAARVEVALPSGAHVASDEEDLESVISALLGRAVNFTASVPAAPTLEEYWPDLDDLAHRDEVTVEAMPPQTFFDCAMVHVLTTGTLRALRAADADADFAVGRFRPNVLVDSGDDATFAEDAWIGKSVRLGDEVELFVSGPAPRCVMTTLAQRGLAADLGVLRTAAREHSAHVGVYAEVRRGGTVALGDRIAFAS
jgi:uncharacterized protein YcbX